MDSRIPKSLLLFIIIGSVLRAYQIGFQCVWTEEEFTLGIIRNGWIELIFQSLTNDFNPPVYYLAAKATSLVFPVWWAIRIPSLVAGILLIPAMYLSGLVYKDELTGVWCAGIASILFPLVYYSQYGRAYSLLFLFFALFLACWIYRVRAISVPNIVNYTMWGMAVLCVWTHFFSIVPIGILLGIIIIDSRKWDDIRLGVLSLALSIPVFWSVTAGSALRTNANYPYGQSLLELVLTTPGEFFGVLFVLIGMLIAIAFYVPKDDCYQNILKILFVTAFITILAGFVSATRTPFFPRYYMVAGLILLFIACTAMDAMSYGISTVISRSQEERDVWCGYAAVAVVLVFLAVQCTDFWTYYSVQKYTCDVWALPLTTT